MNVSVGIPSFNNCVTIGRVVEAVKAQSHHPLEILVVDDGSCDGTGAEAMALGVRVLTHERNLGLAHARNTIMEHAKGDIIAFFDSDAVPKPDCLANLVAHFDDPKVGAVGGRGVEGGLISDAQRWRARTTPQDHGSKEIESDWMVMGLCAAFRTQVLRDVGGFDSTFDRAGEDVDISLRIRDAGHRLVYDPTAVVEHLPGGGLTDITKQAYKHARFATYALRKNGKSRLPYVINTYRHLGTTAFDDLRSGRVNDSVIGVMNLMARSAGFLAGSLPGNGRTQRRIF
ncbi:MAG: glycosyltransferase family 2 protein [Deltaproteobacteria bacterium]|nr:glycosyltransferase family 2 protein [Deltaproteobacteria bacterium]